MKELNVTILENTPAALLDAALLLADAELAALLEAWPPQALRPSIAARAAAAAIAINLVFTIYAPFPLAAVLQPAFTCYSLFHG